MPLRRAKHRKGKTFNLANSVKLITHLVKQTLYKPYLQKFNLLPYDTHQLDVESPLVAVRSLN